MCKLPSLLLQQAMILLHVYVYAVLLFLQQAVTQSKVLVDTVAVNMTWKAPTEGLQKVAFWYDTD